MIIALILFIVGLVAMVDAWLVMELLSITTLYALRSSAWMTRVDRFAFMEFVVGGICATVSAAYLLAEGAKWLLK